MSSFVARLKTLEAGPLAELRRSLSFEPGAYPRVFPLVERFLPNNIAAWQREAHYLVAGLFALKERAAEDSSQRKPLAESDPTAVPEKNTRDRGLGWSLAWLKRDREPPSLERRFLHLLDAESDELTQPLRQAVSLLKAGDAPVDWDQLLSDLQHWRSGERFVQKRWAQQFYRPTAPNTEEGAL